MTPKCPNCKRDQDDCVCVDEIESLRSQVAEAMAMLAAQDAEYNTKTNALIKRHSEQLALTQADNQRLREFAQKISEQIPEKPDYWSSCGQCSNNADEAEDLIAQSQDVSALEAIVQKAGEVMRERCNRSSVDRIQYLPGVTLGDLK